MVKISAAFKDQGVFLIFHFTIYTESLIHLYYIDSVKQQQFLTKVEELTIEKISDIPDGIIRKNLTLRLWAGAFHAAKAIRENPDGSRGPDKVIPPWMSEIIFLQLIDGLFIFMFNAVRAHIKFKNTTSSINTPATPTGLGAIC